MTWIKWIWILPLILVVRFIFLKGKNENNAIPRKYLRKPFPKVWEDILNSEVLFYIQLPEADKIIFKKKILEFLYDVKIIGIKTSVTEQLRILTAASAVIPTFKLEGFRFNFIDEVAILPTIIHDGLINAHGQFRSHPYGNVVILYKDSLIKGFQINNDKQNVGIHEFIHAMDMADGELNGIPDISLPKELRTSWVKAMYKTIEEIKSNNSSIDQYGALNEEEFFAVVSTHYFEQPKQLEKEHPDIYNMLNRIFIQNPDLHLKINRPREIRRNEPCPCGSGLKFKKCCIKN